MGRFIVVWLIVSALSGGFIFLMNRKEKKTTASILNKVAASLLIGGLILGVIMILNRM
jgi:preprotein translocase subunit YajC